MRVVKPTPGGLERIVSRPAEVVAAQQADIAPMISGTVKELSVDIGDRVKKGQVLAVLDAPLTVKDAEQAAAAVEMAKGQVLEAEASIATAEAEIKTARGVMRSAKKRRKGEKATQDLRRDTSQEHSEFG